MKHKHLIIFSSVMVAAWVLGTFLLIYFWPNYVSNIYKKAIVNQGFGDGPVPINTLYTEPQKLFAEPITSPPASGAPASGASASGSKLMTTGVNHDTLLTVGWLDLSQGPLVLHVPDMNGPGSSGRYYSLQFSDPFDVNFAYVGKRTTGTQAGDFLITGPGWQGALPSGMTQIASPNNSVLVIGRVLVESESDLTTAYGLSKQIQLTPLSHWQPR